MAVPPPDAWGRRVIAHRLAGGHGGANGFADLDELTFMLRSGSDRTGALDFQASPWGLRSPRGRQRDPRTLTGFGRPGRSRPAARTGLGRSLAARHGDRGERGRRRSSGTEALKFVAKFSSSTDTYSVVKAEFIAMRLAALVRAECCAGQSRPGDKQGRAVDPPLRP